MFKAIFGQLANSQKKKEEISGNFAVRRKMKEIYVFDFFRIDIVASSKISSSGLSA